MSAPRINLLPVRAAQRHGAARNEIFAVALVLGAAAAGLYYWYAATESEIAEIAYETRQLQQSIGLLKKNVDRVEEFKKKTQLLEEKIEVIETLERRKIGPARLLEKLSEILTGHKKVWLVKLEEKDGEITMLGRAMEHENISEFQLELSQQKDYFLNVKLNVVNTIREGSLEYLEWEMTCDSDYSSG